MNSTRLRATAVAVLCAVGLASMAVTLTFAHGGDSDKVHACVQKSTGQLRVVGADEACRGAEYALDWAVGGPGGGGGGGAVLDTGTLPDCTVQTTPGACAARTLPAGSWVLSYKGVVWVNAAAMNNQYPTCSLVVGGAAVDSHPPMRMSVNGGVMMVTAAVTVAASTPVEIQCSAASSAQVTLTSQRLLAQGASSVSAWAP